MTQEIQFIETVMENKRLQLELSAAHGKTIQLQSFVAIERKRAEKSDELLLDEKAAHRKSMETYLDFVRLFIEQSKELEKLKLQMV